MIRIIHKDDFPLTMFDMDNKDISALNISTGPLALRTFQTAGPVRASTLYLSLALQDHRVKCRASRLKIRTCIFFRESLTWRDAVRAVIPKTMVIPRKSP